MVTAELAIGFLAVMLVLAAAVAGIGEVALRIRALDAAQVGARLAARGEETGTVLRVTQARAPGGSVVSADRSADTVTVQVTAPGLRMLGGVHLPALQVSVTGPVER